MFPIISSSLVGIESNPVTVETDISSGMTSFTIVGLPDTSVKEARDRIRAALKNTGFQFPRGRIVVNLAPADLKKQGPLFDVPIALSILTARGEIPHEELGSCVILGELALDGSVRPIRGALSAGLMARRLKKTDVMVPKENVNEVAVLKDLTVYGISTLKEVIDHVLRVSRIPPATYEPATQNATSEVMCFSHIKGQPLAKRGLEIAAAGGHHVLLSGPPGTGKTLLAKSFPSILPQLSEEESIEVTRIASIAGELNRFGGLIQTRPFRSPHHSSSAVSLVGGGTWPIPGEITLAHRGVLFLDELPEFPRNVIEHLRQPLEDGVVTISRVNATVKFPAQFQLIAAMNPCPCGYLSDPKHACVCSMSQVHHYQKRISGPLMDRFDLRIEVSQIPEDDFLNDARSESSTDIQMRVSQARKKQTDRFLNIPIHLNTEMSPEHLELFCALNQETRALLAHAMNKQSLSPRACTRVRKVARTIADLSGSETIEVMHLAEALQFRESQAFIRS